MHRIKPQRKNNRFYNDLNHHAESFWFGTVPSFMRALWQRNRYVPANVHSDWLHTEQPVSTSHEPRITWIGHASFLIQIGGINILTDPVFGDLSMLFKRMIPAGISLNALPTIDLIVLSHNHRDHMDSTSLHAIKQQFPNCRIVVPWGDKHWFDQRGYAHVTEHMWWEHELVTNHETVTATFLPAHHWSQRSFFDKNRSLWGSWMISWQNYHIYFGGDTAYSPHFAHIAQEFPSIDVALLPVGPCEPRWWMQRTHMDAREACQAFLDLGAQNFVPMHWGTFAFGLDNFITPIEYLRTAWQEKEHELGAKQVHIIKAGEGMYVNKQFVFDMSNEKQINK